MAILFFAIVGAYVISALAALISWVKGESRPTPSTKVDVDVHVHQQEQSQPQWPTIAEQLDGRLTNIVKNPLEGIL